MEDAVGQDGKSFLSAIHARGVADPGVLPVLEVVKFARNGLYASCSDIVGRLRHVAAES